MVLCPGQRGACEERPFAEQSAQKDSQTYWVKEHSHSSLWDLFVPEDLRVTDLVDFIWHVTSLSKTTASWLSPWLCGSLSREKEQSGMCLSVSHEGKQRLPRCWPREHAPHRAGVISWGWRSEVWVNVKMHSGPQQHRSVMGEGGRGRICAYSKKSLRSYPLFLHVPGIKWDSWTHFISRKWYVHICICAYVFHTCICIHIYPSLCMYTHISIHMYL